jgi:DNA-binding LacI/PurR family transcriptional regulator
MDDIAKRLGVSKGTVSKALNGATDVSESMRKAVVEMAVELGYSRILRSGTSQRVCIFVKNMSYDKEDDFGWEIITGFRKMAEPAGFQVDVIPLTTQLEREQHYDEYMLLNDYRGALFLGLALTDPWIQDFKTSHTPTILYDNRIKNNPSIASIEVDNDEGMEIAVSRLIELGHQKIGYLSGALGSHVYQSRYMAFFHALRQNRLDSNHTMAAHSFYISECLEQHLPKLLERGCTAIICSHDLLAHTVIIHCRELGIKIPDDLSIIGFDDIPLCRYTTPPLSSIRQNRDDLGRSAFYALESQIKQIPISMLLLHAELIERESIGIAPKKQPLLENQP